MKDGMETRLHVDAALTADVAVSLEKAQTHYLRNVLRLTAGDEIAVFNGRDGEWRARIEEIGRRRIAVRPIELTRAQSTGPDVWLAFAPIKRARTDFAAQKATELGVSLLWPVLTRRTIVDRVNVDRLRANAIEAAEQTDRLTVPEIRDPVKLAVLLDRWPIDRPLILCDESGAGRPLFDAMTQVPLERARGVGFVIGPEGGFADAELDRMRRLPFVTSVSLGPRLLRADTAALAVLAAWQAIAGDWR